MIGFDNIGKMGRLGNQMFQHAAVKGIARKHGYEYCIPPKDPSQQIDNYGCLLYTSPSPRDLSTSRMPSSA